MAEIDETYVDCCERNWDGHGAEPVSVRALGVAYQIVERITSAKHLTVGCDPDGSISLDWIPETEPWFSISIDADGMIAIAATKKEDAK